jgi:GT2 family glycosyltransferase
MTNPSVHVVILNWERAHDTLACVRSVRASDYEDLRLLVVDNGSTDNSVQEISAAFPDAELLALPENSGFAGGNNAGIAHVVPHAPDLILLLNNDTVVEPNAISELVQSLVQDERWSIAVPKICYHDNPQRIWAAGCRWRRFPPRVTMIGLDQIDGPKYHHARELSYATGCALLARREVFEETQGFDPRFVNYHEDYDFCYRARQASFRLTYVPQATVLHKVSQSLGQDHSARWYYLGRNNVLFYRPGERFPWWALLSFLIWGTLREVKNGHLKLLPAFWRGVRDGFAALREGAAEDNNASAEM